MRKKLTAALTVATVVGACVFALSACGKDEPKSKPAPEPQPDYNNVVIDGLNEVFIDKDTESFGLMDGVTATYTFEDDTTVSLDSAVRTVLPAQAVVKDGKVTFTECGDYDIVYYVNDNEGNHSVAKRTVKVRNIYNCYMMSATLPVLYCALDIVSNNYKSLLTFTRSDTLDISVLDDDRFIYKINGASMNDLRKSWAMTARIAQDDEYSYFRLFITDVYSQSEIFSMMRYGIPSYRYEVKLVSDGSYTYNSAFSDYRKADSYNTWVNNKAIYDGVIDKALKGEFTSVNESTGEVKIVYNGKTIGDDVVASGLNKMAIMAAQRDNVELWCGYPETLTSKDPNVQAEIDKAHMPKMAPEEMYKNLSDEQKAEFLKLCNFDKDDFDKTYFTEQGEYLIITGTNPFIGSLSDDEFADVLKRIVADYKGYNLLFKPHPRAMEPTDAMPKTKAVLQENNIKILPGRLPMEVISWVYSDVALGGFDSSLFMAVPQGNTKFFIAKDSTALSELSKQLYDDGAFGTPKFYWKAA